jgi:hypothetical protein
MADHSAMRLGLTLSGPTPEVPHLDRLMALASPPVPPDVVDWTHGIDGWPMLRNDELGDCTVAGLLHYAQAASRWRDGTGLRATDADAEAGYRAVGWDGQGEGSGARLVDVMTCWRDVGFACAGSVDRIDSFIRLAPASLKTALWIAGPLMLGLSLPIAAQVQDVWPTPASLDGKNTPDGWGGHCVLLAGLDADGRAKLVTWGGVKIATAGWLAAYLTEAWAPVHPLWIARGHTPSGWLVDALEREMAVLGN